MKNSIKVLAMLAIVAMAGMAKAQSSASSSADISATVIVPITIAKTSDMALGKLVGAPTAGTLTLAADGTRTFNQASNTYATNSAPGTPAAFHVTGDASCTFSTVHTGVGAGAGVNHLFLADGSGNFMAFDLDVTASQTLAGGAVDYKVTSVDRCESGCRIVYRFFY